MGSEDGGQGSSKSRTTKRQLNGGPSSVVGGGLALGIATVVVVGVAGKLFSKLRKPNGSASNNNPSITPTDSLDKTVSEENSDLQIHVEGVTLPTNEVLSINGKSYGALNLQNGGSDHNDTSDTSVGVDPMNSTHNDTESESTPGVIIGSKLSPDELHSDRDSGSLLIHHATTNEGEDSDSTASAIALSELLNHALLDAKQHESPSKHELLSNTKALQDGIVGVISRAFEDFSYGGDTSSDELLTPTKLRLTISWETNSSSGSEEEVAQAHSEELVAENELLQPGSTQTEADGHAIESEDEEVAPEADDSSSTPIEEQEGELQDTTRTEGDKTRRGEDSQTTGSFVQSNESTNPAVVPEVQEDKIEHESLEGVLQPVKEIQEIVSLLDEVVKKETTFQGCIGVQKDADCTKKVEVSVEVTSNLLKSVESSPDGITATEGENSVQVSTHIAEEEGVTMAATEIETTSKDCNKVQHHTDQDCDDVQNHVDSNEEAEVLVEVTPNLWRSTECSSIEITAAESENSVQVSTQIGEKEGITLPMTTKETTSQECDHDVHKHTDHTEDAKISVRVDCNLVSGITAAKGEDPIEMSIQMADSIEGSIESVESLVPLATSSQVTNITKTVAVEESTIAAGTQKTHAVRNVDLNISSTAGALKQELGWKGNRLWLEGLGLAVLIALIAVLVWSMSARSTFSVPRLH